jgi:hypothetical protein
MTLSDAEAKLEAAILAYSRAVEEGGTLLTGWVVVGEFMDADGTPLLSAWASRGLPYWRINGLIDAASDVVAYEYEEEEDLD